MIIIILFVSLIGLLYILKNRYETYLESDPKVVDLKNKLVTTFPELRSIRIMKGSSSYTIDKSKIYLCVEHNGVTYDDNMLTYVLLHELAHVINSKIGHGIEFRNTFNRLLIRAEINGFYDPNKPRIEKYCQSS